MQERFDCAVKGRKVAEDECDNTLFNATTEQLVLCKACPRGAALAKTAANWRDTRPLDTPDQSQLPIFVPPLLAAPPKRATARETVLALTGCASIKKLCEHIPFAEPSVHRMLQRLDKGTTPRSDNRVLPAIAAYAGISMPDLFARLGVEQPDLWFRDAPPASASTSSPPQLSGPADPSPLAGLGGPAEPEATEAAEELEDSAESPAPGSIAAIVGGSIATQAEEALAQAEDMPGQAPPVIVGPRAALTLMGADPAEQLLSASELDALRQPAAEIPPDLVAYAGGLHAVQYSPPRLTLQKNGQFEFSAGAMREFGLEAVEWMLPHWSPSRQQVWLQPQADCAAPGTLKMQKSRTLRRLTAGGFLRRFGIDAIRARGSYPIHRGPGNMLVATITDQAQAGKEAA